VSRWVLLAICVVFGIYVVLQLLPGARRGRRSTAAEVRAARARAAAATTPEERAIALADAADAAARGRRWTSAGGLFLRALRADPTRPQVVARLVAALEGPRPRMVESILWRRYAALPDDARHHAAALELAVALAGLYERRLRDRPRAAVLRRLAAHERRRVVTTEE
jgi:hypothetical protein